MATDHKIRVRILGGRPGWRSINASGSAVYPRERAWSVLSNEGKAVSQYLSHFNLVVQEEERLVPRKFAELTACNEKKTGSVVSRVMSGLAQVRVPKRKVKANSEPVKLLQPAVPSRYILTCISAGLNIGKDILLIGLK